MISPFFLIRCSSHPNLVQNNFKSSDFAYFRRLVSHLFELKTRTIVILIPTCDERLFSHLRRELALYIFIYFLR